MLTESERQWLEHRDAMQFLTGTYIADFAEYPLWNTGQDWQDAAEFEATVAAKLATNENCGVDEDCPPNMPYGWGRLKTARLSVEEEMDEADRSRT